MNFSMGRSCIALQSHLNCTLALSLINTTKALTAGESGSTVACTQQGRQHCMLVCFSYAHRLLAIKIKLAKQFANNMQSGGLTVDCSLTAADQQPAADQSATHIWSALYEESKHALNRVPGHCSIRCEHHWCWQHLKASSAQCFPAASVVVAAVHTKNTADLAWPAACCYS